MSISEINSYTNIYNIYNKDNKNKTQKKNNNNISEGKKNSYKNYTNDYETKAQKNNNLVDTETINNSEKPEFDNIDDLMSYLSEKYVVVNKGMTNISSSYLKECLKDEEKLNNLYNMLEEADIALKDAEENIKGFQSMKVNIDKDGNMEYETSGGSVVFNEEKRARQLASAKTVSEVRMVLNLLNKDLSDCKNGAANGMCDEAEVAKVEAMIRRAQQRMSQVSISEDAESNDGTSSFYINMLM